MHKISIYILCCCASISALANTFSKSYKILCPDNENGCACLSSPNGSIKQKLYHYTPVVGESGKDEGSNQPSTWITLLINSNKCYIKSDFLSPIYWNSDTCPNTDTFKSLPFFSSSQFLQSGNINNAKINIGDIFPTFYNIASEEFFTSPKTESLYEANTNKFIAKVSKEFRENLDIEGTGALEDGRIINVGVQVNSEWRYVILPKGSYGLGIKSHYLYPYRTAAVDFDYLCEKMGNPNCTNSETNKKNLVGTLLYIPKLVGIALPNGDIHDGYICAQDIGGAIKKDRIDLFVGPMGGGNPYLPFCQSENAYNANGVQSIVPNDWHLWTKTSATTYKRLLPFEYRTNVPEKGLEIFIVNGAKCKENWTE